MFTNLDAALTKHTEVGMDIQAVVFGTLGGLAIFLFGMNFMSEGLKMMGSETFKRILPAGDSENSTEEF